MLEIVKLKFCSNWATPGRFTWKVWRMQSCKSQFSKVAKKGKLLRMFSLLCSLTKNDVEFLPVEISSEKVRVNNVNFLTIKITSKKVIGNNVDSLIIKLHRKKYVKKGGYFGQRNYFKKSTWKQSVFFDQQNYIEKCTWKQRGFFDHRNYVEKSTWKWRGNLSKFALRRKDDSTWCARWVFTTRFCCQVGITTFM